MKNKIVLDFESKKWYRVVKSIYIIFFVFAILWGNMACLVDGSSPVWVFIVTNLSIIFIMGGIEGLFWYIVNGKWGYPKEIEYDDFNKTINTLVLVDKGLSPLEEKMNWVDILIDEHISIYLPPNYHKVETSVSNTLNSYILNIDQTKLNIEIIKVPFNLHIDSSNIETTIKNLIDANFVILLDYLITNGAKRKNIIFEADKIINSGTSIWYRAKNFYKEDTSVSKEQVGGMYEKRMMDIIGLETNIHNSFIKIEYHYECRGNDEKIKRLINDITKSYEYDE